MPKLYTSPFWVPWGGWRSYNSSSGAVQSFSEENTMDELIKGHECKRMLSSMKMHTCVKRVRVVIFAGRPEACQTIICNLQNEPTVHDAIGWLKVPVAADVAVVKIVHSLVERRPINRLALTCKYMLLEKRPHSRTAQSRQNCCEIMLNSSREDSQFWAETLRQMWSEATPVSVLCWVLLAAYTKI